jgi:hypothetical protein
MAWAAPVAQNGNSVITWIVTGAPLSSSDTVEVSFLNGSPIRLLEVLKSLGAFGLGGPTFEVTVEVVGGSFTTYFIRGGVIP